MQVHNVSQCHTSTLHAGRTLDADVRGVVYKNVRALQWRSSEQRPQLGNRVRSVNGIFVQLIHRAAVVAAVPTNVEGIGKATGTAQIAEQNCRGWLCNARHFGEQIPRLGQVMQH